MKNFINLGIYSLVLRSIAQGLLAILPIIVSNTRVSKSLNGIFMTIVYSMILAGSYITGKKYSDQVSSRKFILISCLSTTVLIFSFGFFKGFYSLLLVNSLLWFSAGINFTTVNILTGQFSGK